MTRPAYLAALLALSALVAPGLIVPASASPCSERIAGLEKRVKAESTEAISASTSGQGAAAKRGGEGVTGTEGNAPGQSPQAPPEKSAEAGKGADAAQQAKVALDEARTADGKGDAKACEAALTRAEAQLKAAP
ncbi:hypothetical protein MKK70_26285 [Methylobacterium sp. E-041]|uniref:hypothetical protein n=1 Tax=Methylobacterium sp. E-041 TaxID=2836573 RepID=UPI001FBA49EF|nr:hypothetical protein [Methylobacterium sp. E-041]MCJ2108821.1 hypothetical protein [Methylobacterium sp. E-041]